MTTHGDDVSEAAVRAHVADSIAASAALDASKAAIAAAKEASDAALRAAGLRAKTGSYAIMQAVVWLVAALLAYGVINARLQVLEVRYDRMSQDVSEIRADVKQLLRQQK